jgi:hypothetical protein
MMNICNRRRTEGIFACSYRQDVHRFCVVSSSKFQVADAGKHFDFFFYSNCLNIEQIDNVHRHAHMYVVLFAIRASSSLNV